jgi:L-alanine-DL-glutamate epimerase-like enolase superfamily enzyme
MKDLELEPFSLRMRTTVRAAWGTLDRRELLRVRLRDTGNDFGFGEAAPLEAYDGVSLAAVRAELERGEPTLPHAVAAVNMAEWDLRGRRDSRPVAALLAEDPLPAVPVNALVTAEDRETASAQAATAVAAGFRCVKVKVGVGDDAGRLAAVRAAVGSDVALRIDANGAWTVEEAIATLGALGPVGIELCEEPVHGVEALRAVRAAVEIPVAMDETALEPGAPGSGAADAVCLRVGAHGGISRVLETAAAARGAGSDVYLASTFDGPVGVAAGLHAAAALRVTRPCGLATLALFDGLADPFPPADGAIALPDKPGLGVV